MPAEPTEFERKVRRVCNKNRYPFTFKDGGVGHRVPDFINREQKKIIEVYNPARTTEEVQKRVNIFSVHGYKFTYLTKDNLTSSGWEKFCKGAINGFLGHD